MGFCLKTAVATDNLWMIAWYLVISVLAVFDCACVHKTVANKPHIQYCYLHQLFIICSTLELWQFVIYSVLRHCNLTFTTIQQHNIVQQTMQIALPCFCLEQSLSELDAIWTGVIYYYKWGSHISTGYRISTQVIKLAHFMEFLCLWCSMVFGKWPIIYFFIDSCFAKTIHRMANFV